MINLIKKNINRDHIFTGLNQIWRLISGPFTLILIPLFLTQEEQGYWFTFISLAALMILADLGFSNIVLQFAAHEFAYLRFNDKNQIVGEEINLKKLAAFFVFSIKWAIFLIAVSLPVISVIGFYLLSQKPTEIHWSFPWLIYIAGSALTFFNSIILCFFEGCDSVGTVQKKRVMISVLMTIIMWVGLILRFNLYALSISLLLSSCIGIFLIYKEFYAAISSLISISKTYTYSWKKEFFTLFWKYAVSWASGYFIFQLFTPFIFHFNGAVEAGKVGISIALWTAIFSIANIWVYVITPKLNMHISKKEWKKLDRLFFKNITLSIITFLIGTITVFFLIFLLKGKVTIIDRFVSNTSMSLLAAAWFFQTIINACAIYLRAHKEEPLVILSAVIAVYVVITTFLCAKYLSPDYFFLGYLSSYLFAVPWVLYIFYNKRRLKHKDEYMA